ncbi:choline dehydrogenase [Nocardia sp. CA-119907]|uniref:choline dehydrogenase n=1 Tax=Nocardia sp. CA-119907 TaxID=3239973 RepID=UPI003D958EC7
MSTNPGHRGSRRAGEVFDFIIVGGGAAGCVLANRLSEDPSTRVLLLEAGRSDYPWDLYIHMPGAFQFTIGKRLYDWKYESDPEPHMHGRRISHPRGKVLGGSSSINAMNFQRGNPLDYERWGADPGMEKWDFAHCLPYFKRMENAIDSGDEWRGDAGPLKIERGPAKNPLFDAMFEAVQQAGYSLTDDVNGYRQEGFSTFDRNIYRGRRLSAARAYLHPVKRRPNLHVRTQALVTGVIMRGKRAVGVSYSRLGRAHTAFGEEIILSGGAINSPQLLQLSGIGNARELHAVGVAPIHDLPGVGENLQDHLETYVQYACKQPVTLAPALKWRNRPKIGLQWLLTHTGPAATNHFECGGFIRSDETIEYPNLMFHMLPLAIRVDGTAHPGHGYQGHIGPMYSDARGSLKIKSSDPRQHPSMVFNYLSTEQDRHEWVQSIRVARHILTQPAFDAFNAGELSPGPSVQSDEQILDWVRREAETGLHPSCTAKMGTDSASVLDPSTLRVWGIDGLRVVDASSMPHITNGNIYAPVVMLAEKAADLILGNTPLQPLEQEFYRSSSDQAEVPGLSD